jgi:hypothetical protein
MADLLVRCLRDRLRRALLRETADRRLFFFLRCLRAAITPPCSRTAFCQAESFRRLRAPRFPESLPLRRAATACFTPPCSRTAFCQAVRRLLPRRAARYGFPGLSVASQKPIGFLYLW